MRRRIKQAKVLHVVSVDDCKRYVLPRKNYGKNTIHNFDFSFRIVTIENKPYFFRHEICACVGYKGCYVEEAVKHYFSEVDNSFMLYTVAFSQFAPKTEQLVVYDEEVTIAALKNMIDSSWNALEYCKPQLDVIDFIQNVALPDWYQNNTLQTFTNNEVFNYFSIRAIMIDDEPYFVAVDVCKALDIQNPNRVVSEMLDDDEKLQVDRQILTNGVVNTLRNSEGISGTVYKPSKINPMINLVTVPGLFQLTFLSRKPNAKAFKRWLAHEVLPTLYRTGSYSMIHKLKAGDD